VQPNGADTPPTPSPLVQPAPAPNGHGEPRAKLHLGFGNSNGQTNGHSNGNGSGNGHGNGAVQPQQPRPFQAPPRANPFDNGQSNRDFSAMREPRPPGQAPQMPRDDVPARKDGSALDQELRSRVDGDIAAFLAAFDAVLAADTQESRFGLKEATDRLLRVGARTRIELERLEARVPLTPRDGGRAEAGGWRYR
jgi:hypothetical protein